jgi:hypothetical protein
MVSKALLDAERKVDDLLTGSLTSVHCGLLDSLLLHHSTVITIRGDSYRLREKRRAGLLQKAGPTLDTNETTAQ